jgi:S1-C subfamily serine protease
MMMPEGAFGALELVPVTPNLGRYFGAETGMLVVRAPGQPGLPLEEGDVLLTIGGRTPESPGQAFRILNSYEPGEKVKLGILRNRKRVEVEATVPPRGGPMGQPRSPMPPTPSAPPQPAPPQGRTSST